MSSFKPAIQYGAPSNLRPELLLHPNIPKPLHGLAPRTILGKEWWDKVRNKTVNRQGNHCAACGVPATRAAHRRYLEAHELYHIDYDRAFALYNGTVALCNSCHAYIHCGRLNHLYSKGLDTEWVLAVLEHGRRLLKQSDLEPTDTQQYSYSAIRGLPLDPDVMTRLQELDREAPAWSAWRLLLGDKEYYSKFKDHEEWEEYYANIDRT